MIQYIVVIANRVKWRKHGPMSHSHALQSLSITSDSLDVGS